MENLAHPYFIDSAGSMIESTDSMIIFSGRSGDCLVDVIPIFYIESVYNIILSRFIKFFDRAMKSESTVVRNVFL